MDKITDISLVAKVVAFNDRKAFDSLVRKYQEPVRRFFLSQTLGDKPLSDDLAQDTFVKAYTRIGSFRGMSGFSTWLYRIAYNVLYDYRRAHKETEDMELARGKRSEASADSGLKMDIYEALKQLRDDERTCITLQLMEGQTLSGIVHITGMTEGTVKSNLSRGKHKLAAYLKENGYGR